MAWHAAMLLRLGGLGARFEVASAHPGRCTLARRFCFSCSCCGGGQRVVWDRGGTCSIHGSIRPSEHGQLLEEIA